MPTKVQRNRRQSDKCMIPLTVGTRIVASPYCFEHKLCMDSGFNMPLCCPANDTSLVSRCCCSYLAQKPVFLDETVGQIQELSFEFFSIMICRTMSFWSVILTSLLFVFCRISVAEPSEDAHGPLTAFRQSTRDVQEKLYAKMRKPTLSAGVMRFFLHPGRRKDSIYALSCKYVTFVGVSPFIGGAAFFVYIGVLFARTGAVVLRAFTFVLRYCVSPYDPMFFLPLF